MLFRSVGRSPRSQDDERAGAAGVRAEIVVTDGDRAATIRRGRNAGHVRGRDGRAIEDAVRRAGDERDGR